MKIYIAGKITGIPYAEYCQKFQNAEDLLRAKGHTPVNPVDLTKDLPKDAPWEEFMALTHIHLLRSQAIYLLHDWLDSPGARIEHAVATARGMKILDYTYFQNHRHA